MKHIDDLFRDGLGGRKGDVPADLWNKIKSARPAVPAGEALDKTFADALRDREAPVPIGMWDRIVAARALPANRVRYIAAALLLLLISSAALWLSQPTEPTLPEQKMEETVITDREGYAVTDGSEETGYPVDASPIVAAKTTPSLTKQITPTRALNAGAREGGLLKASSTVENPEERRVNLPVLESAPMNEVSGAEGTIDRAGASTKIEPYRERSASEVIVSILPPKEVLPDFDKGKHRVKPLKNPGFSRAPRHRTGTEMLFGAAYANQNLAAAGAGDRQLLAARENSEFPELSFQITLRQSYKLTDRLTLTGGLTYVDIRNQFDYEEVVNGTLQLTRKNNHIRMLEVPVLAGLTLPGRRFNVSLNAGPVFNLTTSVQGSFLDPDSPEPLSLADDGDYRRYTGVGYMTSLTTTYAIGKKDPFVLVLEPFFKHYPGSFTNAGSRLRESYWLAGLQLGVRKGL